MSTQPTTFTDPATGRPYTVGPDGQSRWLDQPQPTSPRRKKHTLRNVALGVGAGFLAIGMIGAATGGGKTSNTTSPVASAGQPSTSAKAAPPTAKTVAAPKPAVKPAKPGIGVPVRDGKFEFTVLKVKPGVAKVGNEYLGAVAQGQFVMITVKVENIGDDSRMFTGASQYLYDTKGRKFDADTEAGIYLKDSKSFLTDINPGNTVTGTLVFDVPKGADLARAELHDSIFSGGVEVALS